MYINVNLTFTHKNNIIFNILRMLCINNIRLFQERFPSKLREFLSKNIIQMLEDRVFLLHHENKHH